MLLRATRYDYRRRKDWDNTFRVIGLTHQQVCTLYDVYFEIDDDGSMSISPDEFLDYFNVAGARKFTLKLFDFMDTDGGGTLDFLEFTIAVWNFCTLSNEDMPLFIFDLYDEDSSNTMDMKELAGVLRDLASGAEGGSSANGKKVGRAEAIRRAGNSDAHIEKSLQMVREHLPSASESLSREEFYVLCNEHQTSLLSPAMILQKCLREKVAGLKFWREQIALRAKNDDGSKLAKIRAMSQKIADKEKAARKSHDQFVRKGKDSDLYKEEKKKGSMRGSFDKARASLDSINSDK